MDMRVACRFTHSLECLVKSLWIPVSVLVLLGTTLEAAVAQVDGLDMGIGTLDSRALARIVSVPGAPRPGIVAPRCVIERLPCICAYA